MPPNRLKHLRETLGLSLDALAARVGTTNQQISHLELGRRQLTVHWLRRLAPALGCPPWEIVEDLGPANAQEAKLLSMFRSLSPEDQDAFLAEVASRAAPRSRTPNRRR